MTAADALPDFEDVLAAAERVRGVARETPILTHEALDALAGGSLFIKAECLQVTGSFKIRGAMNRLSQIPDSGFFLWLSCSGRCAGRAFAGYARGNCHAI